MQRRRARTLAVCSAAGWIAHARPGDAQDATTAPAAAVSLDVASCRGIDGAELRRIASIDLGAPVTPGGDGSARGTQVAVECEANVAVVRVRDSVTAATLSRRVDLGPPSDSARTRLLALAAVELVTASWVSLVPTPAVPPAPSAGSTAPPGSSRPPALSVVPDPVLRASPPPPAAPRTWLTVTGGVRSFVPGALSLWGGGFVLNLRQEALLGAVFDVSVEHGEAVGIPPPPRVVTDSVSVGGALLIQARGPFFTARAGIGARFGLAWVSDRSVEAAPVLAPWAGPFLMVGLGVRVARRFVIDARFEQGLALGALGPLAPRWGGVVGANLWIAAHVGFGVEF